MDGVMICLVGEQPLPNLLPIRYDRPKHVLLAYTKDTKQVSGRLEKVLAEEETQVHPCKVPPFNIPAIRRTLGKAIADEKWASSQLVFNLTGGTKAMAFAGYSLAEAWRTHFIYLDSDEAPSGVYRYHFSGEENKAASLHMDETDDLPALINLDDYLRVHLDWYECKSFPEDTGGRFEELVYQVLECAPGVDEVKHSVHAMRDLEIDLVMRRGNRVGIAECKTGKKATKKIGVDQLNTAARREFLGIYTQKFLIVSKEWDRSATLRPLVESSDIRLIELSSYDENTQSLSEGDRERLIRGIRETMGCR